MRVAYQFFGTVDWFWAHFHAENGDILHSVPKHKRMVDLCMKKWGSKKLLDPVLEKVGVI